VALGLDSLVELGDLDEVMNMINSNDGDDSDMRGVVRQTAMRG
jgi:hypothetical protein